MNIAIIGTGSVGGSIGTQWAKCNHKVVYGVREINERVKQRLKESDDRAEALPISNALTKCGVVLLAIPGKAVDDFLAAHGDALNGKLIIDATNRTGSDAFHDLNAIQVVAPEAQVVRAFNTLGWEMFADPIVGGEQASLFFCGPLESRATAETLIADVGLHPVYVGGIEQIETVDSLAKLWFSLAFGQKMGRRVALRLITES
ncbi:MAG: NAD(P)-binding domain-containing protein [Chloroflexota bacterium]